MPSLRIGKILGIPVEVNASWLAIFVLVAASLSFDYFPGQFGWSAGLSLLVGVFTALLFFLSVVAHEMSHSVVARAGGIRINRVTLFLFGGVAEMAEEPHGPGKEFLMAVAGPGMSLVLAAAFFLTYTAARAVGASAVLWGPTQYLAMINLAVAVFNLLPGFPLDGGRVLRAILWKATGDLLKATLWASRVGQLIGYGMVATSVFGVLSYGASFIWFGLVGWFLAVLADTSYRQQLAKARMGAVRVGDIMTPSPVVVPGDLSLEELAHGYFLGGLHSRYPVVSDGRVVGLISLAGAKAVPRELWSQRTAEDAAEKNLQLLIVGADESADSVLERLVADEPGALLVVSEGRVSGIVTRSDVLARLRSDGQFG